MNHILIIHNKIGNDLVLATLDDTTDGKAITDLSVNIVKLDGEIEKVIEVCEPNIIEINKPFMTIRFTSNIFSLGEFCLVRVSYTLV
jgi:hypothetical protein